MCRSQKFTASQGKPGRNASGPSVVIGRVQEYQRGTLFVPPWVIRMGVNEVAGTALRRLPQVAAMAQCNRGFSVSRKHAEAGRLMTLASVAAADCIYCGLGMMRLPPRQFEKEQRRLLVQVSLCVRRFILKRRSINLHRYRVTTKNFTYRTDTRAELYHRAIPRQESDQLFAQKRL